MLRPPAGGSRRRYLQQLVRAPGFGVGWGRAGSTFRSDALPEELDRHALCRADLGGAQRRVRPGGANSHLRARLHFRRAGQEFAGPMRRLRQGGVQIVRSGRRPGSSRTAPSRPDVCGARVRRRFDRLSPRSAVDLRDFPGWAVERSSPFTPQSAWLTTTGAERLPFVRFTSIRRSDSARPTSSRQSHIPPRAKDGRSSI